MSRLVPAKGPYAAGDRVRYTRKDGSVPYGTHGTVRRCYESDPVLVDVDCDEGTLLITGAHNLEAVSAWDGTGSAWYGVTR